MNRAIITVGPQGAGKSTFCEQIVMERPSVKLISRDQIFKEVLGKVYLNPYTDNCRPATTELWRRVEEALRGEDITLILDYMNVSDLDRNCLSDRLRTLNADSVEAWVFTTPESVCWERLIRRDELSNSLARRKHANDVSCKLRAWRPDPMSFDLVQYIDPLQGFLFSPSYVLLGPE